MRMAGHQVKLPASVGLNPKVVCSHTNLKQPQMPDTQHHHEEVVNRLFVEVSG